MPWAVNISDEQSQTALPRITNTFYIGLKKKKKQENKEQNFYTSYLGSELENSMYMPIDKNLKGSE